MKENEMKFKWLLDGITKKSSEHISIRNLQNFLLVWLDTNIDEENNPDCCNTIRQLRETINCFKIFTDVDQCIDFITNIEDEKVFLILSGSLGQTIVPVINNISQIDSIYVFCRNERKHKQWAEHWLKIRGVFTNIQLICEELKQAAYQCDKNAISIGFISSDQNSDQINSSFMYTQILKEILLKIQYDKQSLNELIDYIREQFRDNSIELEKINKLEKEYHNYSPIWWYTYDCCLYSMLNRALRTMEVDIIIKMGFFIRDLHKNIETLHSQQYTYKNKKQLLTVYRGQGLSRTDFDQLIKTKGGLLSFNNFLSTSKKPNISLQYARRSLTNLDLIGVLFVIIIDPCLSSTPFASIKNVSCYQSEREILFSMHSVFRIGQSKQIDYDNDRLWQVELILTIDNDPQRRVLTERIRADIRGINGWQYLGKFLIMLGQFQKADDLYTILLDRTRSESDRAQFYHHLGVIKDGEGDYDMAIDYYEKSLKINREIRSQDHHYLASTYSGIGLVHFKKHNYIEALQAHEKALEIFRKTFVQNNSHIAISYGNIGKVYDAMGEYTQSLISHEKALEIFQETLPSNHFRLATCYFDIGQVYYKVNHFSQSLSMHIKALEIRRQCLSPNHPLLAASYNSVGELYFKTEEYTKGLTYIKHAIELGQRSLPSNHRDLELYKQNLNFCQVSF